VAEWIGVIVGFVNGPVIETPFITDDLFQDIKANPLSGGHQSVLGIAVTPHFQTRGVAAALLAHLEEYAKEKKRRYKGIAFNKCICSSSLQCLANIITSIVCSIK
jgi:GNAT superfamily N-acetyltransferase